MEQLATNFLSQQSGPLAVIIGVIAALLWLGVKTKKAVSTVWPFLRKLVALVEDLFGTEARPGVPARDGLMTRMQRSEENSAAIQSTLSEHSKALEELRPNHGGSMKDVLNATRKELSELRDQLKEHIAQQVSGGPESSVTVNVAAAAS